MGNVLHSQRQMKHELPEDKLGKKCAGCILRNNNALQRDIKDE